MRTDELYEEYPNRPLMQSPWDGKGGSMLSDVDIREMLGSLYMGEPILGIDPWDEKMLQPASVDLKLGEIQSEVSFISPGEFILASTLEVVTLSRCLAGQLAGKSSWARKGLLVEAAGFVDPGFSGSLVLEMTNMSAHPITLPIGEPIAQIVFFWLRTPAQSSYSEKHHGKGKYQDQRGITGPR